MSEFAGVDPHRVRLLANRLKDLAEAIGKNGLIIRNNFSKWGGTLDLSQLARQAAQVGQDAHDMARRADAALNLLHQPNGVSLTSLGPTVSIPWDPKDIDTAKEAKQEAADLKNALANPNDPASRETITEIAQSSTDHQGDSAYTTAFINSGGMNDIAGVASALHQEDATHDGVVLSVDSQKILSQFANVVANTAKSGELHDFKAFTDAPDLWSATMLFKYGPNGKSYGDGSGKDLLAAMSRTVLDHLHDPSLAAPVPAANGQQDHDQTIQRQEVEFNAASAVLTLAAQNGAAARQVLGGPQDPQHNYAKIIENDKWQIPGYSGGNAYTGGRFGTNPVWSIPPVDISGPAGKFLTAATEAPRGTGPESKQAAWAVSNIAQGLPSFTGKDAVFVPPAVQNALVDIADRYRYDLAYAAPAPQGEATPFQEGGHPDNPWITGLSSSALQNLLGQAFHNNGAAYGKFRTEVTNDLGTTAAYATETGNMDPLNNESALLGQLQRSWNALDFDTAQKADAQAAAQKQLLSNVQSGLTFAFGLVSVPAAPEEAAAGALAAVIAKKQGLNIAKLVNTFGLGGSGLQSQYNTGHAMAALQQGNQAFFDTKQNIWFSVAMGLVNQGVIPKPPQHVLYDEQGHIPSEALRQWTEDQLKTKGETDPQVKKLLDRYGSENLFDQLENAAKSQIVADE